MRELVMALLQLVIALLLSGAAAFLAFFLFQWATREIDEVAEIRRGNLAVGLLLGSIVIAVAIILRPALAVDTTAWDVGRSVMWRALAAEALQILVGLVLAVVAVLVALLAFAALTRGLDEIEELKRGNLAVAGLMSGVAVGVGILMSPAVGQLMDLAASFLF